MHKNKNAFVRGGKCRRHKITLITTIPITSLDSKIFFLELYHKSYYELGQSSLIAISMYQRFGAADISPIQSCLLHTNVSFPHFVLTTFKFLSITKIMSIARPQKQVTCRFIIAALVKETNL